MNRCTAIYKKLASNAHPNNLSKILTLLFVLASSVAASASASPQLSRVSCNSNNYRGAGTDACTVYLTTNTNARSTVTLTSSNPEVNVPSSVTVKSGAISSRFNATVSSVATAQTATITAQAGGITQTFSITLSPASGVAALTVSASSVSFGNVTVGSKGTQSVTLTSSGTAPVTISSISVAGSLFGATGITPPVTLNPGQTAT